MLNWTWIEHAHCYCLYSKCTSERIKAEWSLSPTECRSIKAADMTAVTIPRRNTQEGSWWKHSGSHSPQWLRKSKILRRCQQWIRWNGTPTITMMKWCLDMLGALCRAQGCGSAPSKHIDLGCWFCSEIDFGVEMQLTRLYFSCEVVFTSFYFVYETCARMCKQKGICYL